MDKTGYLTRPKLRAAYDRICDSPRGLRLHCECVASAEAFLRMIQRNADYRGITFDENAERLGY